MKREEDFKFSDTVFAFPMALILLIWVIYWLEIRYNWNFNKHGIYPRTLGGLKGIFTAPFIHGDTKHLFNNSVPLFVLCASLFYFYRKVALKVLLIGGFLTGFFTWSIGRPAHHIGASGIVYLLFSFIFLSGIIKKHYRLVAMSLIVIFLYGSIIWYVIPIKEGVSWEGHLSGLLVGVVLAFLLKNKGVVKEKYLFAKTEFDDMFDDEGNYDPSLVEKDEDEQFLEDDEGFTYRYFYTDE